MIRTRHFEFIVRCLLQIVLFFVTQLPVSYEVQVDRDRFLSAFSIINDDVRVQVPPWPTGPGWAPMEGQPRPLASPPNRVEAQLPCSFPASYERSDVMPEMVDVDKPSSGKIQLCNPYGNSLRHMVLRLWAEFVPVVANTIPAVVLAYRGVEGGVLAGGGCKTITCEHPSHLFTK
jgi:hypothetical protein